MLEHEDHTTQKRGDEIIVSSSCIEIITLSKSSSAFSSSSSSFSRSPVSYNQSFPMTSYCSNDISVPCRVRRHCLVSDHHHHDPCDDKQQQQQQDTRHSIISFEGDAIPMICSISPWTSSDQQKESSAFTPELLLQPQFTQTPLPPQRMPLLMRRGHENAASAGINISHTRSSNSSNSRILSKSRTAPSLPPQEISIMNSSPVIHQPSCINDSNDTSEPIMPAAAPSHYRIPLHDILLVDTTTTTTTTLKSSTTTTALEQQSGCSTNSAIAGGNSSSRKLILILPSYALEIDCISRNSYDLILACLEAFVKKSKIRKIKNKKSNKKKHLLGLSSSKSCHSSNTNTTTATTASMTTTTTTNGNSQYVSSTTTSMTGKDNEINNRMMLSSDACSSVDALTDHIMFLASESESLVDKLGRRIGKAMADITDTLCSK